MLRRWHTVSCLWLLWYLASKLQAWTKLKDYSQSTRRINVNVYENIARSGWKEGLRRTRKWEDGRKTLNFSEERAK